MRRLLLGSICSLTMTTVASAAEYPKGTYSVSAFQMCLIAPSGFSNDSGGNPTIPNGNDSYIGANTFQGFITFDGEGAGRVAGVYAYINPPPPDSRSTPKPSIGGGKSAYDVTTTPIVDNEFSVTSKPGTIQNTIDFGPAAGQQASADVANRHFVVSDSRKTMAVTVTTPYVETTTLSGSPNVHTTRSCMLAGNLNRME
jgi:hypothetical protein